MDFQSVTFLLMFLYSLEGMSCFRADSNGADEVFSTVGRDEGFTFDGEL